MKIHLVQNVISDA